MRARLAALSIVGLVALGWFFLSQRHPRPTQDHNKASAPVHSSTAIMIPPLAVEGSVPPPPFAERILEHYADPARPPEEDVQALARTLDNFALLVKGDNPLPLGANEEIAAALRGKNKAGLRALPDGHRAFNAQGQLVDRWGSPLYFHAQSRDRLEVRSAGPDRQMWTADDLHRRHDGRFLRGDALLAPSLFDATPSQR